MSFIDDILNSISSALLKFNNFCMLCNYKLLRNTRFTSDEKPNRDEIMKCKVVS